MPSLVQMSRIRACKRGKRTPRYMLTTRANLLVEGECILLDINRHTDQVVEEVTFMEPENEVEWPAVETSLVSLVISSAACRELLEGTRALIVLGIRKGFPYWLRVF